MRIWRARSLLISCWLSAMIYLYCYKYKPYEYTRNLSDLGPALKSDRGYFFEPCHCLKHADRTGRRTKRSTCSEEASWYGPHQKVISYSLYQSPYGVLEDNFTIFRDGIDMNLKQIKKYYPEWVVRIYTNETLDETYCKAACDDKVFWCDIRNCSVPHMNSTNGRVWRFLPLGDETVDIFGSRDIDSYVVVREQEVVDEWEFLSDKSFHLARDYPFGTPRPMMAGFWNAKNYLFGTRKARRVLGRILLRARNNHDINLDEILLWEILYNENVKEFLEHDAYTCEKWNRTKPFPKKRKAGVSRIGDGIKLHDIRKQIWPCPPACRPSYGKNWTYC